MTILRIGTERLKKAENTVPDLRHGKQERPTSAESDSCRSFFQSMYYKVAESLPDRFIRRKRKRTTHGHKQFQYDTDDSSFYEADGEEEQNDDADLFAWLDKATDGPLHSIALNSSNLVQRFLPPGNLTELYDHYQVVQSMLGISPASSFGCICLSSTVQLY